jgi:hypothetical protein
MGEMRNAQENVVEKTEEKKPICRPRHRWEDNIELDLWKYVNGIIWLKVGSSVRVS